MINRFVGPTTIVKNVSRQRLASLSNDQSKPKNPHLHMLKKSNDYKLKANSLPSILDTCEDGSGEKPEYFNLNNDQGIRSPKYSRQQTIPLEIELVKSVEISNTQVEYQVFVRELSKKNNRNCYPRQGSLGNTVEMDPDPTPYNPLLPTHHDPTVSRASSICSRKDSGIRSNSRRSSIQHQVYFCF